MKKWGLEGTNRQGPKDIVKNLKDVVKYIKEKYNGDLNRLKDAVLEEAEKVNESDKPRFIANLLLLELSSIPAFGQKQASLLLREIIDLGGWPDLSYIKEFIPASLDYHVKKFFYEVAERCKYPSEKIRWKKDGKYEYDVWKNFVASRTHEHR